MPNELWIPITINWATKAAAHIAHPHPPSGIILMLDPKANLFCLVNCCSGLVSLSDPEELVMTERETENQCRRARWQIANYLKSLKASDGGQPLVSNFIGGWKSYILFSWQGVKAIASPKTIAVFTLENETPSQSIANQYDEFAILVWRHHAKATLP